MGDDKTARSARNHLGDSSGRHLSAERGLLGTRLRAQPCFKGRFGATCGPKKGVCRTLSIQATERSATSAEVSGGAASKYGRKYVRARLCSALPQRNILEIFRGPTAGPSHRPLKIEAYGQLAARAPRAAQSADAKRLQCPRSASSSRRPDATPPDIGVRGYTAIPCPRLAPPSATEIRAAQRLTSRTSSSTLFVSFRFTPRVRPTQPKPGQEHA